MVEQDDKGSVTGTGHSKPTIFMFFNRLEPLKMWLKRRLGFGLLEAFLLFTFLSFGISLGLDYYSAVRSARDIGHRLFNQHVSSLSSELSRIQATVDLLMTAGRARAAARNNPARDWRSANMLFMPFMKEYPIITSINYGNDRGDGYLILHVEGYWKNRIRLSEDPGFVTWITLSEDGRVKGISRLRDDYDPRVRPWYRIAEKQIQWSPPYVFRTTRDLGVTASARITRAEVLGIDIMLKDLSFMLSGMIRSGDETLSLVDADGFIWAHSDVKNFEARLAESDEAPRITENGYERIKFGVRDHIKSEYVRGPYPEDEPFFTASEQVAFKGTRPVYLVSVRLENRHLAEFLRISVVKVVILSLLLVVFAGIFIWRYILPLRRITRAISRYDFSESAALTISNREDEIGRLSREFERMTREIGERQRSLQDSERECRRLSAEFRALLDAIPDNLTLQDRNYTILWANRAAAEQLGKRPDDLVGRPCYELWHNRSTKCESCPVRETFETGQPAAVTVTSPDNRIWDLRTVPLKDEFGHVVNVIEVGRDITDHRKLEAQLLQAQKMEAVGLLAGGVAHDFNNILTAIIGYANLTLMGLEEDSHLRHNVNQILDASQRAANLTQSLLAFGRKQTMNLKALDLNELLKRFQKFLRRLLREDIELKLQTAVVSIHILADQGQIEQVLMNLITNARDAMPDGGSITLETRIVTIDETFTNAHGYGRPGQYAMLSVTDTGIGMDEETRQKIFDPFFTTKEPGKGTGLGLAMVYGIIKKHEGFINVYSEPGKGATFKIYLPVAQGTDVQNVVADSDFQNVPIGSETILVAEDDAALLELAVSMLGRFGYTVITAHDGADAVEKFIQNRERISLVVLDGIMPKMNGKEVYLRIKDIWPQVKAIFMSGYAEDIFTKDGILQHEVAFIQKPVSPTELARKVREVLDSRQ